MPPKRKRADQVQDKRFVPVVIDGGKSDTPDADPGWMQQTCDAWSTYWASNVAASLDGDEASVLRRLFDMRDRQARAWIRYDESPYVDGSKGQPVANPALADALSLERAILALEDRLGLSPKARANLGIAFGQAALTAADLNRMALEAAGAGDDDVIEVEGWEAVD